MEFYVENLSAIFWSLSLLAGGWLAGWVVEYFFLRNLEPSNWFRKALAGIGHWMGLAAGLALALRYRLLPADWHSAAVLAWKISALMIVTVFAGRLVGRYIHQQTVGLSGDLPSTSLAHHVMRGLVYMIGILVILQTLDISITPVLTALGVGGLAVALALQDTLTNLFAGIQIIASRKIRPGQFIRLEGGEEGYVHDIAWRNTTIRTLPNMMVIVPNAKLSSSIVTNSYLPSEEVSAKVELGVHYDSDLERVEQVALETAMTIAESFPGGVTEPAPAVRFRGFGDSAINMAVVFRVREYTDQFPMQHLLVKALHKRFREEGIVIPYPIRTLDLGGLGLPEKLTN
jgi:small-conductance mechanosensitive channel